MDFSSDRVAADTEFLRGLNAAPARAVQGRQDELGFELAGQFVPNVVPAFFKQASGLNFQTVQPIASEWPRRCRFVQGSRTLRTVLSLRTV